MRWPIYLLALLLTGCAAQPVVGPPATPVNEARCQTLYRALDQLTRQYGVQDAASHRLQDYPFLRSNRYLAAYGQQLGDPARFAEWIDAMALLDLQGRRLELANLPPHAGNELPEESLRRLDQCATQLAQALARYPEALPQLREQARVPDHYRTWQRAVGLYPLAASAATLALQRLHDELREPFDAATSPPPAGRLVQYRPPPDSESLQPLIAPMQSRQAALPRVAATTDLAGLFQRHAPLIEVDERDHNDRIGYPYWPDANRPDVDSTRPTLFLHLGQTRFLGESLLQLNYLFWFPARETGDLYSGRFDAVVWRVTLDQALQPIAYESIHACGCYYQLFPVAGYRPRPSPPDTEAVLVPATLPQLATGQRRVLRLAAGTHYLQRIETVTATEDGVTYRFADAATLRSLPLPAGGRRSLYGPDGILIASARPERWLLWPFGVASPGAMRQFGTHAIAFVGRRHFDDPELLQQLLAPVD